VAVRLRGLSALLVFAVAAAGCGTKGRGGGRGLSAPAARFDAVVRRAGVTLEASGRNCSGLYGSWQVRLRASGPVHGSQSTRFRLVRGQETQLPVTFRIRAGVLRGHATGLLGIRGEGRRLRVRGRVEVKVPFVKRSATIDEKIPVTRGPAPGCGLSG
jgi:hypothetical protein